MVAADPLLGHTYHIPSHLDEALDVLLLRRSPPWWKAV